MSDLIIADLFLRNSLPNCLLHVDDCIRKYQKIMPTVVGQISDYQIKDQR